MGNKFFYFNQDNRNIHKSFVREGERERERTYAILFNYKMI